MKNRRNFLKKIGLAGAFVVSAKTVADAINDPLEDHEVTLSPRLTIHSVKQGMIITVRQEENSITRKYESDGTKGITLEGFSLGKIVVSIRHFHFLGHKRYVFPEDTYGLEIDTREFWNVEKMGEPFFTPSATPSATRISPPSPTPTPVESDIGSDETIRTHTLRVQRVNPYVKPVKGHKYGFNIEDPPDEKGIFTILGNLPDPEDGAIINFGGNGLELKAKLLRYTEIGKNRDLKDGEIRLKRYYFELI